MSADNMPSRGHAIRESSGPGSAEAMDLLDSIYPGDVQRPAGLASGTAGGAGSSSNGTTTGQAASDLALGGLASVPENQQLNDAGILPQQSNSPSPIPSTAFEYHQRQRLLAIQQEAADAAPSAASGSREASSQVTQSPSGTLDASADQTSRFTASSSETHTPGSGTATPGASDVFGPTLSSSAASKRPASMFVGPRRSTSNSSIQSGLKPLPGLPSQPVMGNLPNAEREQENLLLSKTSPPKAEQAFQTLHQTPLGFPPQHIPRPVAMLHSSSSTDSERTAGHHQDVSSASAQATGGPTTAHASSNGRQAPPATRPISIPGPTALHAQEAGPFSPIEGEPNRSLRDSNRSSIEDIRRLHAQRAHASRMADSGAVAAPAARMDFISTSSPSSATRREGARPMSVIEPRSIRDMMSPGVANNGGVAPPQSVSNASRESGVRAPPSTASARSQAERESHSQRNGADVRDREERDRERERRARRTLGDYALGKTLGAGSMGKVKLGVKMGSGEKVAIKIIPRHTSLAAAQQGRNGENADGNEKPQPPPTASFLAKAAAKDHSKEIRTIREGSLQLLLHHPYVCGMREMMIHPNHYYMVFEYVNGGQMLDYIISHGRLRERAARKFARQIGSALEYCHRNSIVHRDLKIENILISKTGNIKIIDFGLSNLYSPHSHLNTFCGSLYFAAPELLNAKAYTGPEVDVWSFGIVLYVLVCGKVPFDDQSMPALHAKIKKGNVEYPAWLSGECKHILSRMLVTNPSARATLPEILAHPWMVKGYDGPPNSHLSARQPLRTDSLDPEVVKGMTGFEFGSPQDIETRLLEILTSDLYLAALHAWEARNGVQNGNAPSAELGDSSVLGRSSTRTSSESKTRSGNRRFSGIDFYRKKISGSSLFGSKDDSSLGNGANGSSSLNGPMGSSVQAKEPLDPTRAFHPLISIYYLVQEKMEREKLYGHSFFASSSISLNGNNIAGGSSALAAPTTALSGIPMSSMPTAADIPQETLRMPEVSHIASASRREGPMPTLPASPNRVRASPFGAPTPVFDSREKSQPLPNMTGPPRARAQGDEVEAALRSKGLGPPAAAPSSVAPLPQIGGWSDGSSSMRRQSVTSPLVSSPTYARTSARSAGSEAQEEQPARLSTSGPPAPLAKDTSPSSRADKRRSYHAGMQQGTLGIGGAPRVAAQSQDTARDQSPGKTGSSLAPPSPQSASSGSSLARRFSTLLGRSPSSAPETEQRERRKQSRMSTGGMGNDSLADARRPNGQMTGSPSLAGVAESHAEESKAVEDEQLRTNGQSLQPPQEEQRVERVSAERRTASLTPRGRGEVRRAGTITEGRRSGGTNQGSTAVGTVGRNRGSNGRRDAETFEKDAGSGSPDGEAPGATAMTASPSSDAMASKPVFLKGLFSVQTTTTKPRAQLHADLIRVLDRVGLQYCEVKGGYECVYMPSLDFQPQVGGSSPLGPVASGRGNARITQEEEYGVDSRSRQSPSENTDDWDASSSPSRPKRGTSRFSFMTGRRKTQQSPSQGMDDPMDAAAVSDGRSRAGSNATNLLAPDKRSVEAEQEQARNRTETQSLGLAPPVPAKAGQSATEEANYSQGGASSGQQAQQLADELAVRFEINVVKVPLLLGVNGLQFRRISGNPWQYQQLARRVLQELKL